MVFKEPKGMLDILPEQISDWEFLNQQIEKFMKTYHYQKIQTPIVELTKVFKRENDSSDMVNKEMYTFSLGSDSLTLRPEGTAGVMRSIVQHKLYASGENPLKLYYVGQMFRHDRPQKGRYRQFHQFGVENVGVINPMVDAEVISLAYYFVKSLKISQVKVSINTLGDNESRQAYRNALSAYFKNHLDCLCPDCKRRYQQNPLRILDCKIDKENPIVVNAPELKDYLTQEAQIYFEAVLAALKALDIPYEIDKRLVRGLDYYCETVFEIISTHDASGAQSTVLGGGRYSGLTTYFEGPELPGVGFAAGMERLLLLMELEGVLPKKESSLDVYVLTLTKNTIVPLQVATRLRNSGYCVEVNAVERSFKSQFKSVDRLNAKNVVIIGDDEIEKGVVNVKNIATQMQKTVTLDELVDTIKMLEKGENI